MPNSKRNLLIVTFFLLVSSVLFYGCQKELSTENGGTPVVITNQTSIEGRVTDESNMPVAGAKVKAGIATTQTDKNGMFKIANAAFTTSETFVTIEKPGYFKGSRNFFSRSGSNNFVRIQLLRKSVSARIPSATGGDAAMRGNGGSVHFDANSFVTESGAPYNGTVLVATQYIDPAAADVNMQMPGDLRGTNTAGENVGLKSYAMAAVELTGESGQKLQIKPGTKATLSLNIPAALLATAPATIPLWYFNDSTGLWKQEGTAIKNGDNYEGEVAHFSFWNCDDPYYFVKIKMHVLNGAGQALIGAKVQITSTTRGSTAYDYTDNNGYVDGYVPKNETLQLQVFNSCNQAAYTANAGPFTADADLGNITLTQSTTTVYGTAVNCSNQPVADGYVQIILNGHTEFAGITNGNFSSTFLNCPGNNSMLIIAVDNSSLQQSTASTVAVSSNNINLGQLTACGVSANTFFNLTINGTTLSGNTPDFYRYGWRDDSTNIYYNGDIDYYYAAYDSTVTKYVYFVLTLPYNNVFTVPSLYNNFNMGYSGITNSAEEYSLEALDTLTQKIRFTEYGGPGQFIAGDFTGQLERLNYTSNGNAATDTVNATLTFRVRHVTNPF
jgi:hypothetical protein